MGRRDVHCICFVGMKDHPPQHFRLRSAVLLPWPYFPCCSNSYLSPCFLYWDPLCLGCLTWPLSSWPNPDRCSVNRHQLRTCYAPIRTLSTPLRLSLLYRSISMTTLSSKSAHNKFSESSYEILWNYFYKLIILMYLYYADMDHFSIYMINYYFHTLYCFSDSFSYLN